MTGPIDAGIDEDHPTKPASPYAASKLAGEALTLSYYHAYGLPTTVVRPFNTYGPFQRSVGEGGVVAIFTRRSHPRRGAAHLRRRDADPRPALRRGLRAVRGRGTDLGPGDRPDPQCGHRHGRERQRAGGAGRAGPGAGSCTSRTSIPRARSPCCAATRRLAGRAARLAADRWHCPRGSPGSVPGWRSAWGPGSRSTDGHRRRPRGWRSMAARPSARRSCRMPTRSSRTRTSRRSGRRCARTGSRPVRVSRRSKARLPRPPACGTRSRSARGRRRCTARSWPQAWGRAMRRSRRR